MSAASPLISIVTVNRNNADGLRRTISSVACQTFADREHIVIDGASSDASSEVIREYEPYLAYSVSERDAGIYNAMNKGIDHARGRYVLFLNSGDHLQHERALEAAAAHLLGEQIVYFDMEAVAPNGRRIHHTFPASLDFGFFVHNWLPHPASFIARDLFELYGRYDETLKIVSDWKSFLLWVCRFGVTYRYAPVLLSTFYLDGFSSRPENAESSRGEREAVLQAEFGAMYLTFKEAEVTSQLVQSLRGNTILRALQSLRLLRRF